MSQALKTIRLIVPAAKAKPSPSIGQALGALGVNMMAFCKQFNAVTAHYVDDMPMRVQITVYKDNSFSFTQKTPATSWFIKKAAKIEKGAQKPGRQVVGEIHVKQLYEIAKIKLEESPNKRRENLFGYSKSIAATCKSMGVTITSIKEDDLISLNKQIEMDNALAAELREE